MVVKASRIVLSREAWVSASDVSIVGYNEAVVSDVLNVALDDWAIVRLRNSWETLLLKMLWIMLLVDKLTNLASNFLAESDSFLICNLGMES